MLPNINLKRWREPCIQNPGADLRSARFERSDVFGIQLFDALLDARSQAIPGNKLTVGVGRRAAAARDANAGSGQAADHFAKGRVFASDLVQVLQAEIFKPRDAHCQCILSSESWVLLS